MSAAPRASSSHSPSFWNGWRTEISYSICKLIFALTAFPFLPLNIGIVNTLFTHAVRTAYNKEGQLTKQDRAGLSAYTRFLRKDVLGNARFDRELREAPFGEDDRRKLAEVSVPTPAASRSAYNRACGPRRVPAHLRLCVSTPR